MVGIAIGARRCQRGRNDEVIRLHAEKIRVLDDGAQLLVLLAAVADVLLEGAHHLLEPGRRLSTAQQAL